MPSIPGTIPLSGQLAPTDSTDTYPVIDSRYGIGSALEVDDHAQRDAITSERRREGMRCYTKNDQSYWQLLPAPWVFEASDWAQADLFTVLVDGVLVGREVSLNIYPGQSITLAAVDNPSNETVDLTIGATKTYCFLLGVGAPITLPGVNLTNELIVTQPSHIRACYLSAKTAPTNSDLIIQLKINANPIFDGGLSLAVGDSYLTTTSFALTELHAGDLLSVDVVQADGVVANVTVQLEASQ